MEQEQRIKMENGLIWILALASLVLLIVTFIPIGMLSDKVSTYMEMSKMVARVFCVIMIVVCTQLMLRKYMAWLIAVIISIINIVRGLAGFHHTYRLVLVAVGAVVLLMLYYFKEDFCCPASKASMKKALGFLVLAMVGIVANASLSFYYMSLTMHRVVSMKESFSNGIAILFGVSTIPGGSGVHYFESLIFFFSWLCIAAAIFHAVRPWLIEKKKGKAEIQHARTLLNLYSQNPAAYLTLEEDKTLFFGQKVDGVIPYGVVHNVVVMNGDPVCAPKDFPELLAEFKEFCQKSAHQLFILNATDCFLEEYKKQGFGFAKCGEEARFNLDEYEISGKKGQKMRMNINHAKKAGVTVEEYKLHKKRDPEIEKEINRISDEWLEGKKTSLLQFVLGTVGLEDPMDKRYFYARNAEGKIVAFIVFVPFMGLDGYMADVTRRGKDAPGGVMEYIIYEAFQVFKEEGVKYGSLGIAPLAGLDEKSGNLVERLLSFVYRHLNQCYGFRDLYRAKKNYSPNEWLPSYYVYMPSIPTPAMFYAIVRIQNPSGMLDYIKSFIRNR